MHENFAITALAALTLGCSGGSGFSSAADCEGLSMGEQADECWAQHAAEVFRTDPNRGVEIVENEPERRKQLWENTAYMKQELALLGYDTGDSESPVIPLLVGEDIVAFKMAIRLQEEGVFANPVITPAVPQGRAMIRTSYMATHTRDQLDRALEALSKVGRELTVI